MIRPYKKKELIDLFDYVLESKNKEEFYFTKDNKRVYVNEEFSSYEKLIENSIFVFVDDGGEFNQINGCVMAWKSIYKQLDGSEKIRYYLKIAYETIDQAEKLLTVFLWNFPKELYIKIEKKSPLNYILKKAKFLFVGDRGDSVLLRRDKIPILKQNKINKVEYE